MSIALEHITKTFGKFQALSDVSLEVKNGELLALLGPSGSGKTTLLRIIAGLDVPDRSQGTAIQFDGIAVDWDNPAQRHVGFVFQHYALFRTMTVFENVAFGLRVRPKSQRPSNEAIRKKVNELLSLIQLETMADRYPSQLSGGQRQRVALARALAIEPKILLLDEPFGALDAKVRQSLRRWLRRLHDEIHVTSVLVTHDQEEALEVSDRVVIMNGGRIEQVGSPDEVFHQPASPFVMDFLGNVNLFHARTDTANGGAAWAFGQAPSGREGRILVRPHDLDISLTPSGTQAVAARIVRIQTAGSLVKVELATETGEEALVEISHEKLRMLGIRKDEQVFVSLKEQRVFIEDYSI